MAGLRQVWRHITVHTVLTQEEILEEDEKNNNTNYFNILMIFNEDVYIQNKTLFTLILVSKFPIL